LYIKQGVSPVADISESELKIFIDTVTHYFAHLTSEPAVIRSAYLVDASMPRFDYTGLITLSGQFRGCVYFSAPRLMLRELLLQLCEPDVSDDNLLDVVGEVANTIAGNARKHFGAALEISTPLTIRGSSDQVKPAVRARPFAIVLRWHRCEAVVVVDLETIG
jgi:chemotaxis protein CheX